MGFRCLARAGRALVAGAVLASAGALSGGPGQAQALESDWQTFDHSRVRLITGQVAPDADGKLDAGLEFRLEEGWKIYWRSPGDAGLPPEADWSGSQGLEKADMAWPVPERFELFGISNNGYHGDTVFPLDLSLTNPQAETSLALKLDYLICSDICVPATANLSLTLPAALEGQSPAETGHAALIRQFRDRVPVSGQKEDKGDNGPAILSARFVGDAEKGELTVLIREAAGLQSPDLFIEPPAGMDGLIFQPPRLSLAADGTTAVLRSSGERQTGSGNLNAVPLVLTAVSGGQGVELAMNTATGYEADLSADELVVLTAGSAGQVGDVPSVGEAAQAVQDAVPEAEEDPLALPDAGTALLLFGIAFLGGMILNFMPCVLPVLSLKLLSVIHHGGQSRKQIRIGFLATAAGILFSFLVLAGLATGLRSAGVAVGWGMQFQQPLFLTFMVLLLVLFAANLWGWFEVPLPSWLIERVIIRGKDGHDHLSGASLLANFSLGAFATLLATPCSAPFVGSAITFALTSPSLVTILVFLVMGAGFALPYLLVTLWPALAQKMPRPGRWMVWLRAFMGLALAATGIWLLTVIAGQRGVPAATTVGGLMTGILALLWLGHRRGRLRLVAWAGVLLLAVLSFQAPGVPKPVSDLAGSGRGEASENARIDWEHFDKSLIPALVKDGKTVLVDVTADWCITCKVNKSLVIDSDPVIARLRSDHIVAMKADWTSPDPEIASYLKANNRYGIPFNIVYGPAAPEGIALPELLTESLVLEALEKAAGDRNNMAEGSTFQ